MPSELAFAQEERKRIQQLHGRPLHEVKEAMEVWENSEDKIFGGILSFIATPDYSKLISRAIGAQANQRLSNLALAATAYKADNGEYPASLDLLKGKYITTIPTDPFNGEEIRVKHVEGGMLLYSYGENKVDDKGREDDITFALGKAYFDKVEEEKIRREEHKKKKEAVAPLE